METSTVVSWDQWPIGPVEFENWWPKLAQLLQNVSGHRASAIDEPWPNSVCLQMADWKDTQVPRSQWLQLSDVLLPGAWARQRWRWVHKLLSHGTSIYFSADVRSVIAATEHCSWIDLVAARLISSDVSALIISPLSSPLLLLTWQQFVIDMYVLTFYLVEMPGTHFGILNR